MSAFSQYGGASKEWLELAKSLPPMTFDPNVDPAALKAFVNNNREERNEPKYQAIASQVETETFDITVRDGHVIQARSYRPRSQPKDAILPVFLYFHGGGWLYGTLDGENLTCARHAIAGGVLVVSVNYRHTPDFVFPSAWTDTQDAFAWLHANAQTLHFDPHQVVVGGESAGALLTASLVLEKHIGKSDVMRGLPAIAGQILMIPPTADWDHYDELVTSQLAQGEVNSMLENEFAPILPVVACHYFVDLLKIGNHPDKPTKFSVLSATSDTLKGLPPTAFGVCGLDPLRDEGLLYAKKLAEAGVPTDVRLLKGLPHGFRGLADGLSITEEYDKVTDEGIPWTLSRPAASGKFEIKVFT